MSYAKWKNQNQSIATATVATVATLEQKIGFESDKKLSSVAKVASVAVAASENKKKSEPLPKIEPLSKSPVFGGGNSVILANGANQQTANGPVKKETYSPLEDGQLNRKSEDKQSPENLGDVLKTEQTTAPNIRDTFTPTVDAPTVEQPPLGDVPTVERKIPFNLDNYSHCVTCNQCEYLSFTGSCSRLGKRVIATALRECDAFKLLKKERPQIEEVKPYTQDELNRLLNQAAKPLYFHLIDCQQCSLEDARYCVEGFGLGNTFDCLLLCFDDATNKRYELMNPIHHLA